MEVAENEQEWTPISAEVGRVRLWTQVRRKMGSGVDAGKLVGTEGKQVLQKAQIQRQNLFCKGSLGSAGTIKAAYYVIVVDQEWKYTNMKTE